MKIWQAIVLGITQGLAEFLPISSSGHLVLVRSIMGIEGDYMMFDIMAHVGTLLAICLVFFKDIINLFKPPFKRLMILALATIPAGITGLLLSSKVDVLFSSGKYLCFFFLATAVVLLITELIAKRTKEPQPFTIKTALSMGLMQSVAVLPGISRSGSTIFGGTLAQGERAEVAKFSFFMSAPLIVCSVVLELFTAELGAIEWTTIIVGMVTSFLSGLFAIKLMLKVISKANYKWFSLYLLVVAIFSFIFLFLK